MSYTVIIQARMGSSRLPGKVMMELHGKTILEHDIERVSVASRVDDIIIATTVEPADDAIVAEAVRLGVKSFRGSEDDVLSRYYEAAKEHHAQNVIRITSDCPLYDGALLDEMIAAFEASECDYLSNCIVRSYPRGLDTEIFKFSALEKAFEQADEEFQREHVTPCINRNPTIFALEDYVAEDDYSHLRWTLDTQEDFDFISAVYDELYSNERLFTTQDVLGLLNARPELVDINAHIEQKKITA